MTEFAALMDRVLAEVDAYEAWDSEFTPNPHSPWGVAEQLATVDAIPYLVSVLDDSRRREWALYALQSLGPKARSASDALAKGGHELTLFYVDEPRARERRLHEKPGLREKIMELVARRSPAEIRTHLEELLTSTDDDVVLFALDAGAYGDKSGLDDLARKHPDAVPLDRVRRIVKEHGSARARHAAISILAWLHLPEDAGLVIDWIATTNALVGKHADWLGSHPSSTRIIDRVDDLGEVFEIVRRRRCAGLATNAEQVRPRVLEALLAPATTEVGLHPDRIRKSKMADAARIVRELADRECASALVEAIGPAPGAHRFEGEGPFEELTAALASLGEAGTRAVEEARAHASGERLERLGWMKDALARQRGIQWDHLGSGDERFEKGNLEDSLLVDSAAFGAYAEALRRDPRCRHAAFQIAWIDRGFGSPITKERITWLRSLGVSGPLLEDLARPPEGIMPGFRFGHERALTASRERAEQALRADFPSIAANYYGKKWPEDRDRCRALAKAHLDRVRAG